MLKIFAINIFDLKYQKFDLGSFAIFPKGRAAALGESSEIFIENPKLLGLKTLVRGSQQKQYRKIKSRRKTHRLTSKPRL